MLKNMSKYFFQGKFWWVLFSVSYAILTIPAIRVTAGHLNPDGVVYILHAQHLLKGEYTASVSAYWGPLFSWLIAGIAAFRIDFLLSAKIVLLSCGYFFSIGVWVLSQRFITNLYARLMLVIIMTGASLVWATQILTPDLIVTTVLVWYFWILTDPRFPSKRLSIIAGLLGGIAFLAKSYALPFFLIHFSVTCILLRGQYKVAPNTDKARLPRNIIVWLYGLVAFSAVVLPWIMVLSVKYHRLEAGSYGRINHALLRPGLAPLQHPIVSGLWEPPENTLTAWEDPTILPYPVWPRLSVTDRLREYGYIIENNSQVALRLVQYDLLRFSQMGIILLLLTALFARLRKLYWWLLLTIVIYSMGYILTMTTADPRYFWPVLVLIAIFVFSVPENIPLRKEYKVALTLLFFASFSYQSLRDLRYLYWFTEPSTAYQEAADKIRSAYPLGSRVAADNWKEGLYISFFLGNTTQYLGVPSSNTNDGFSHELTSSRIDIFLRFFKTESGKALDSDTAWRQTLKIRLTGADSSAHELEVFERNRL